MRIVYHNIFVLLLLLVGDGCKKTIQVDLDDYTTAVVINAQVSDIDSFQVKVFNSTYYYDNMQDSLLTEAKVHITNNTKNEYYSLYPAKGGFFYSPVAGISGDNYTLTVSYDGQTYSANATMPEKVPLDSVTFKKANILGTDIISTVVHFQDPSGDSNYYRFNVTILRTGKTNSFNFQDRLSDGKYVNYTLQNDSAYIHENDSIQVEMMCVTKAAYQFYYGIEMTAGANEKLLNSLSPSNPPTNLSNNALGIFDVYTSRVVRMKVPEKFINSFRWEDLLTW